MDTIELRDALAIMESYVPVSFSAVKYDRNRRSGGEIMKFKDVILVSKFTSKGILKFKLRDSTIRAVHQRLITEFNNKKVIW